MFLFENGARSSESPPAGSVMGSVLSLEGLSGKAHGGQHIRVGDVSIYCETFGARPPVLVLHGGVGYIEDMSFQIRALAKSHFVIAVDSRGHGDQLAHTVR
jgi:pimeloyl-ACP methyl ester carboxylesterase